MTEKFERKYFKTRSTADCETWFKQKIFQQRLFGKNRKEFWNLKFFETEYKSMTTWNYINKVAGKVKAFQDEGIEIISLKNFWIIKLAKSKF